MLLAFHSLFVSHRIVGPLYRFRTTFQAVAAGDLSVRAILRKHDYLGSELESVNQMIASLQAKVHDIEAPSQEVRTLVGVLERALDRGAPEDITQALAGRRVQVERLQGAMAQFRLAPEKTNGEDEGATPVTPPATPEDAAPHTRA